MTNERKAELCAALANKLIEISFYKHYAEYVLKSVGMTEEEAKEMLQEYDANAVKNSDEPYYDEEMLKNMFSVYCKSEDAHGHCLQRCDGYCEFCPVNEAYHFMFEHEDSLEDENDYEDEE